MILKVIDPGLLSTPQDTGRPGLARLGVGASGAADVPALRLANALLGNPHNACALEMTLKGPVLEVQRDSWVALTGAPLPQARINDEPWLMGAVRKVRAGDRLHIGGMPSGCRSYLAVAGGFDFKRCLGSRASDVNAGLGPPPIKAGDVLPIAEPERQLSDDYAWSLDLRSWRQDVGPQQLRIMRSSHTSLLDDASAHALVSDTFTLSADSNRVGCRIDGHSLSLSQATEIISAGSVAGSMQLPPGGQPIVLGCEHPVSGGYPRIAQLIEADLPRLAQCRPGDRLCFEWVDMSTALDARREQRQLIEQIETQIRERLGRTP